MQVNSLALLVVGVLVLALFVLVGFVVHRLADGNAKKIAGVVVALTLLLGAVPALVVAFQVLVS
ncbi:hypothetical protein C8D88_109268 [Lentzea atacamensis]|uniref:Uncharacterized protein n=1 Tax=Lentzea atacamensis TaxID=531938 RepID=A0A316HVP8_9PSEU|nr:hypothetical protein [Lentzea atacamensis]PWK84183.1 hypothetical protein C8D88_109268 [Lentzea atacamensis]RAS69051.1 hypothetical protein C8D87_1021129 [Lentzea atacamensis]